MDTLERIMFRVAISFVFAGLLLAVLASQPSYAGWSEPTDKDTRAQSASSLAAPDQQFIRRAAADSLTEVELGQLAVKRASNSDVRKYAQQMVDDHRKASGHLNELASKKGLTLSTKPTAATEAIKRRLIRFSVDQFDNAYMAEVLKHHKQNVEEFRSESKTTHDPQLRGFVTETLPILEDHLKKAEAIAPDLKAERTASQKPAAGKAKAR